MRLIDADEFKKYADEPSIYDTTDLKAMIDEQPTVTETEELYKNACASIFSMAVAEQKKINADKDHDTERIKAYRISLAFLRPDLTSEEIYNEVECVSHYEWNTETKRYEKKNSN
jgi:hypothetical protein